MESSVATWVSVESKSALDAQLQGNGVIQCVTADANTWGYFALSSGKKIVVGYSNLGLLPAVAMTSNLVIVGIDELVVAFDRVSLKRIFTYHMPSVFHQFVSVSNPLIIRDEVGFVCLTTSGKEIALHLTNGPIAEFSFSNGLLHGETIDGERFSFSVPMSQSSD
jgi:hypothetical protein